MTDNSRTRPAWIDIGSGIDRVVGTVSLAAVLTFVLLMVLVGPYEALERLAFLLRRALPLWAR